VEFDPVDSLPEQKSLVATNDWKPVKFKITDEGNSILVSTDYLTLKLNKESGNITFQEKSGKILLAETQRIIISDTVMGEQVYNLSQSWKLSDDEAIYGLGQLQDGNLNLRNTIDTLIQTNTVAVNPFLVSTQGYGILWDNYSKTIFRDDEKSASFWSEVGDKIDYYFVAGENMDDVISGYRQITGKAPMFGKWAFGYWQSKERYVDANDLMSVVKEYRERKIPIDNIVQDWNYWGDISNKDSIWANAKKNWSSMYFHPSAYKDPAATIKEIHEKYKMHYMISIWPAIGPQTEIYKEMKAKGHLFPPQHWSSGYLYDAYSQEARDIYWKHIKKGIMENGADALWMDGTEPELGDQHTFKISESNIKKFGQTEIGSNARYMNTFSLMTTTGAYNHWRKDFPEKRVFILTRSCFAGQQRNAAVTWSGDVNANWDVFKKQIAAGINYSMAGIPYWTTDIGAFFLHGHDVGHGPGKYKDNTQNAYREFYVRWFQYGTFNPIFRSHGTHTAREIWRFGKKGEWGYETLLKYDNLRYRLLPYIYSLAWKVTDSDYTIMRALAMDFPNDKDAFDINDQFMFGPNILICPVTDEQYFPLDQSKEQGFRTIKTRKVYLPKGSNWYDFWTGEKLDGGQTITRQTPIEIMPLYVKAGSIIPMGPFKQYATEKPEDPIELRVYSGANASFVVYEDENDNYNYEKGIFAEIPIKWNEEKQELIIGKRKGKFPGMLQERTFHIIWVDADHGADIDPEENIDEIVKYLGERIIIKKK
jgi:alpha-D-xyloside xylohydrolase